MASTASSRLRVELQADGDNFNTWGNAHLNEALKRLEEGIADVVPVSLGAADYTLTSTNYVADEARGAVLKLSGTPGASRNIIVPSVEKPYWVHNTTAYDHSVKTAAGASALCKASAITFVYSDGTDCFAANMADTATLDGRYHKLDGSNTPTADTPWGNHKITGLKNGSAASDAATVFQAMPVGAVMPFAGPAAPSGWLLCAGQAVSRTTYAALFTAIGTNYGAGDGSTTFNLPDLRGRAVAGQDNMGGVAANRLTSGTSGIAGTTLGAAGGDERMQQHNHGVTDNGHAHSYAAGVSNGPNGSGTGAMLGTTTSNTGTSTTGISIQNAGAGASQNVQPTMILNYIIYAAA